MVVVILIVVIILMVFYFLPFFDHKDYDYYQEKIKTEEEETKQEDKDAEEELSTRIKTHIAAYFAPTQSDINFIAERFDIIIGSIQQGIPVANQLKSLNSEITILGYRDMVLMENIADTHKDWEIINAHEEWFVHDPSCDDDDTINCRIRTPEERYLMDIGNSNWQAYILNYLKLKLAREEYNNYDGVFLDDVWPGLPWSGWMNDLHPSADFIGNWQKNILEMLTKIKNNLPKEEIVIINGGTNQQALNIVDGIMNEAFVHAPWEEDKKFKSVEDWKKDINSLVYAMENNKLYLAQSGTSGETANKSEIKRTMMFCLASYLLGAGEKSTFSFKDYHYPGYNKIFFYPEWDIDLGIPTEKYDLMPSQNNIYQRKYSKGLVIVNPSDIDSPIINLDRNYKSLDNEIVSQIKIPAYSGVILLTI